MSTLKVIKLCVYSVIFVYQNRIYGTIQRFLTFDNDEHQHYSFSKEFAQEMCEVGDHPMDDA